MAGKQGTWLGCSIVAGVVLALSVSILGPSDKSVLPESAKTYGPLQSEMQLLANSIERWIDQRDPLAQGESLEILSDMVLLVRESDAPAPKNHASRASAYSLIASLQSGLKALTIQDRLILLAEQEVYRTQDADAVGRLFQAHQRREEIISIMVLPAIEILDHSITPVEKLQAQTESTADSSGLFVGI